MDRLTKKINNPTFYTYKVVYDAGNAPNPDFGLCTLAICKPKIRATAKVGDIIVGVGILGESNRIIYCMIVDEVLSWKNYILRCETDKIFKSRIPQSETDHGDCIWSIEKFGCPHQPLISASGHGIGDYETDIKDGKNVLISYSYWYFGSGNKFDIRIPEEFSKILPNRGHKSRMNQPYLDEFILFFNLELERNGIDFYGKYGEPK